MIKTFFSKFSTKEIIYSIEDKSYIASLVLQYAKQNNLEPEILAALIWQESRGNPFAFRYEDAFYFRYIHGKAANQLLGYVPKGIPTLATEKKARAISWGLGQIMGQTAREIGYKEQYLSRLMLPDDNVRLISQYLAQWVKKFGNYDQALARYNGTGEAAKTYAKTIMAHVESGAWRNIIV